MRGPREVSQRSGVFISSDRQTDGKQHITAHRAIAQPVGSKNQMTLTMHVACSKIHAIPEDNLPVFYNVNSFLPIINSSLKIENVMASATAGPYPPGRL